jgi:hypothetical protein
MSDVSRTSNGHIIKRNFVHHSHTDAAQHSGQNGNLESRVSNDDYIEIRVGARVFIHISTNTLKDPNVQCIMISITE